MASLEELFQQACDTRELPGVVLLARDVNGKFQYQKAFGMKSPSEKLALDASFIMASCTKLMTSIAALQCVERGQIGLDDDVSTVLTEVKDIEILTGFKEGTEIPILKKAENKITLRQLLTHSSGFGYDRMNVSLNRWRATRGGGVSTKEMPILQRITTPLLFEPGTSWEYGSSLDWAGLLVGRLNKMSLEAYMQKYIWDPLGIKNITFHLELKPDVRKNLVHLSSRGDAPMMGLAMPNDDKVQWTDEKYYDDPTPDEYGGGGSFGSAVEYMKILHSICSDDGKLLMSETIDEMFTPQLNAGSLEGFLKFSGWCSSNGIFSSQSPGTKLNHGLAGLVTLQDLETGPKSGTLSWSGLPNLLWTIDRESGLSLFYASNITPFGDHKSHKMQQLFQKEMYTRAKL